MTARFDPPNLTRRTLARGLASIGGPGAAHGALHGALARGTTTTEPRPNNRLNGRSVVVNGPAVPVFAAPCPAPCRSLCQDPRGDRPDGRAQPGIAQRRQPARTRPQQRHDQAARQRDPLCFGTEILRSVGMPSLFSDATRHRGQRSGSIPRQVHPSAGCSRYARGSARGLLHRPSGHGQPDLAR